MAGYSKRTLVEKLGIRPGSRLTLQNAPRHYKSLLGRLPEGVSVLTSRATALDLLHLFVTKRIQLKGALPRAKKKIKSDGMIWVSWPKLTSRLQGDLNENLVREIGLANGMVDVKVAAIDEDWSGLKFVFRVKDRPSKS